MKFFEAVKKNGVDYMRFSITEIDYNCTEEQAEVLPKDLDIDIPKHEASHKPLKILIANAIESITGFVNVGFMYNLDR